MEGIRLNLNVPPYITANKKSDLYMRYLLYGLIFGLSYISYILACSFSDQLPVSTKFDMRSDPGVARNYGKLLVEMVSIVPDGIVCFFVSYSYMDEIIATWNDSGILKVKIMFVVSF